MATTRFELVLAPVHSGRTPLAAGRLAVERAARALRDRVRVSRDLDTRLARPEAGVTVGSSWARATADTAVAKLAMLGVPVTVREVVQPHPVRRIADGLEDFGSTFATIPFLGVIATYAAGWALIAAGQASTMAVRGARARRRAGVGGEPRAGAGRPRSAAARTLRLSRRIAALDPKLADHFEVLCISVTARASLERRLTDAVRAQDVDEIRELVTAAMRSIVPHPRTDDVDDLECLVNATFELATIPVEPASPRDAARVLHVVPVARGGWAVRVLPGDRLDAHARLAVVADAFADTAPTLSNEQALIRVGDRAEAEALRAALAERGIVAVVDSRRAALAVGVPSGLAVAAGTALLLMTSPLAAVLIPLGLVGVGITKAIAPATGAITSVRQELAMPATSRHIDAIVQLEHGATSLRSSLVAIRRTLERFALVERPVGDQELVFAAADDLVVLVSEIVHDVERAARVLETCDDSRAAAIVERAPAELERIGKLAARLSALLDTLAG